MPRSRTYESKHDILLGLVCPFLDEVQALLDGTTEPTDARAQRALLASLLDLMLEHRPVVTLLVRDVTAVRQPGIGEQIQLQTDQLTRILAGPNADEDLLIRASAALGALRRPVVEFPEVDLKSRTVRRSSPRRAAPWGFVRVQLAGVLPPDSA